VVIDLSLDSPPPSLHNHAHKKDQPLKKPQPTKPREETKVGEKKAPKEESTDKLT
jgi:hypothetical protein